MLIQSLLPIAPLVQELLVNYMRAVLQLGCVSSDGMSEALALISTDIEADGFKW